MRRSTSLMAQLKAQVREGTELHFENCTGGYFSTDPDYALKVMGRTEQSETTGKNLFPLGDLLNQSNWANTYGDCIMDSDGVSTMLEPQTTYTVSFDAECVGVPDASIDCDDEICVAEGYEGHFLESAHMGLGFVLVPSDTSGPDYGLGLPYENGYPLIDLFVDHQLQKGEKYHGVVTFSTPDTLDGYTLQVLTNQYYYSHYYGPEIHYSTVSFTNVKIEEGLVETPYIPYGQKSTEGTEICVKAGSIIICGESRATVPCDLRDGDVWYPATGIVDRGDSMEKYTPQPLLAPLGDFSVTQEPVELEARLSATMLTRGADSSLSWKDIQAIVRCGLASKYFKVGDQLTCQRGDDTLVWDIIGIDHDTPTDKTFKHSLTLQLHECLPDLVQYDAAEALFYAESELPAGTYNFTLLAGYGASYGGGKTYFFTITNPVPAGGVIVLPWTSQRQVTDVKISTYDSITSSEAIESVAVNEGAEGISLEELGECNHTHRASQGSNNWAESAIRQFLNSEAAAGDVWSPKTVFDRPPLWLTTHDGFLCGIDRDFLSVIGEVDKVTALNTVTDGGGSQTSSERIFLLSVGEVYGGKTNGILEGEAYRYYSVDSDLSYAGTGADANRKKNRNGSAQRWWLRSPHTTSGYYAGCVNVAGTTDATTAMGHQGVAPACCII